MPEIPDRPAVVAGFVRMRSRSEQGVAGVSKRYCSPSYLLRKIFTSGCLDPGSGFFQPEADRVLIFQVDDVEGFAARFQHLIF